jgi:hypothetical protein
MLCTSRLVRMRSEDMNNNNLLNKELSELLDLFKKLESENLLLIQDCQQVRILLSEYLYLYLHFRQRQDWKQGGLCLFGQGPN